MLKFVRFFFWVQCIYNLKVPSHHYTSYMVSIIPTSNFSLVSFHLFVCLYSRTGLIFEQILMKVGTQGLQFHGFILSSAIFIIRVFLSNIFGVCSIVICHLASDLDNISENINCCVKVCDLFNFSRQSCLYCFRVQSRIKINNLTPTHTKPRLASSNLANVCTNIRPSLVAFPFKHCNVPIRHEPCAFFDRTVILPH